MTLDDLRNCATIGLWGLGRDGRETLRAIRAAAPAARIAAFDESGSAADEETRDVRVPFGEAMAMLGAGAMDVLVRSPGVSIYRPEIVAAKSAGLRVTTSMDLWLSTYAGRTFTVVVTGTKGKSTTASLIHHLFSSLGVGSALLGNIGTPMLSCDAPPGVTVIEASSYQLADLTAGPAVAVILNLFQEHLDWHGSEERYYQDKLRLLDLPGVRQRFCGHANEALRRRVADRADIAWFDEPHTGFWSSAEGVHRDGELLLPAADAALKGRHNLSNVCAAFAVVAARLGSLPAEAVRAAAGFRPLRHRLETVHRARGITFVDDSISTTTDSTLAAVRAIDPSPVVLILGGKDRGLRFDELLSALEGCRVKHVVFTGESGRRVFDAIAGRRMAYATSYAPTLDDAVPQAVAAAAPGDTVLLSPASPSYGEFTNFEERGDAFARLAVAIQSID